MKTNLKRISRRSISILLCVLMLFSTLMVGTITANSAYNNDCMKGSWDWNTVYAFNNGTCTISLNASDTPYQFEVYFANVEGKYISPTTITNSTGTPLQLSTDTSRGFLYIKPSVTGDYTFTLDSTNKTLSVTFPGGSTGGGDTHTVFFKNTVDWSDVWVHLYSAEYWNPDSGTGCENIAVVAEHMNKVDGTTDVYSYEYSGDYKYISFTEEEQQGFKYFSNTKAAYRGDLNTAMSNGTPMYVPETTKSGTLNNYNNSSTDYYNNGEWQVLQIGDTVTPISAPTEDKKTNTIIANTNTEAKAQSIWIWGDGVGGKAYNLKGVDTVSTQYLSYHSYSMSNPSAIFVQGTVDTDGSESFPSGDKISTEDVKSTNELTTSVDGHTSVIDGNYYYPVTGKTTTTANFTVFDHIGGTITPDKTEITTGQSIILTGAVTAGTLRKSKIGNVGSDKFTYVVRDSNGQHYRIGDEKTDSATVTWVPTVGGTYTVFGLVTDPFGFESIKVAETTVTVNDPVQQKWTVTYSAGANGSMTCAQDTVNVESGSQVVAGTNVTFTISPDEGYEVDTFTVNDVDKKSEISNKTYTHTVDSDITVNVTFKKTTYNVTVDSGITGGTVTPSTSTANMGDNIILKVEPNMGYFLKSVTVTKASEGTVDCTNNSFTMPADNVTISATFVSYKITGSLTTAGTEDGKDSTWDSFTNGMAFDTKVSDTVYSKTITLVESDFTEGNQRNKFRLKSNDDIVYRPVDSDATYNNKGYLITQSDSEENSYTTMNGTSEKYFYFDAAGEYTLYIKYVAGGNPRIWAEKGAFSLTSTTTRCDVNFYSDADLTNEITQSKANQTVYVKVTPNSYCEVKTVTANNGVKLTPVSDKENVYSFTMPNSDVNVTATAETIKQTVTFSFSNASLTVNYFRNGDPYNNVSVTNGGTVTVDKGTTLGVSATSDSGYEPTTTPWTIDPAPGTTLTTTSNTCNFTVSDNTSVTFKTKKKDYNITYVNNPTQGGTSVVKVNDAEVTKLNIGDKFKVDQTVNKVGGYEIASVQVTADGSALNPNTNDIYTMATGDVTVTTTYKAIKPTISDCPTETVTLYAGQSYTIPAKTDYGALSYSAEPDGELIFNGAVVTAPNHTGNYAITVTATNQPAGITTAATTTATFNITVVLTKTQEAYNELKDVYDEIGHEKSDYYESNGAWTAYQNAVTAADNLLKTFPSPDADDTEKYTEAKTTLQDAYNAIQAFKKVTTIYVLSQYSDYVNLHMFAFSEGFQPVGEVTEISTNSDNSKAYPMTKLGKVKKDNSDKYLYKFEYYGTADFVVYVGDSTNKVIGDNKLTCDVKCCDDITSYYFDLQDVESGKKEGNYSIENIVSPYAPLSVELTNTSDKCVEDTVYDLTANITKTLDGTLYSKSGVTVTHTYTYKLNDEGDVISNPATWAPAEPGVYTITVTSSNGITTEDVKNTFTLYVQDKLDKPILRINSVSTGNITVNDKTDVVLEVTSSGVDYPEGVKYIFTVDNKTYESDTPKYTFKAQTPALGIGTHSVSVQVVAPDTIFPETEYAKYVNSDSSDTRTVTVETVKYTYSFDFTNCHVTVSVAYKLDGKPKTFTELKGDIKVDKESTVTFTVIMTDNYLPIPNDKCWSGVAGATIGNDKLSYSFTATESNADSPVVFKSYLPVSITPLTQNIKIGDSAEITIGGIDRNASYELQYKKVGDTEYKVAPSADLEGNKFTTQSLEYGNYQFIVRQYTDDYEKLSEPVTVNSVIGTVVLKYYYREYNTNNGIAYDPYISIENNLRGTATEYSVTLDRDISTIIDADGNFKKSKCVELYTQYAPKIVSNYFNYELVTSDMNYLLSTDKKTCTIKCEAAMTPLEIVYKVKVNGELKFKSYYQQKTFLLDAVDYCKDQAPYGYMWYYKKGDSIEIVSTDRYYKLRVARDTDLVVAVIEDPSIKGEVTTIINEPVYTEFTNETNAVKVKINMLVENYLPEDAVRTRTGVVYYSYVGEDAPTIKSSELPALIENSVALQNVSAGVTCTVGTTTSDVEIKGYYTNSDNVNGKFIFAPIADINSNKTYVVYSYLTYTIGNESYTVISANPVTASVQEYKAQKSTQTS